jgi:glucosylglycerate synthase
VAVATGLDSLTGATKASVTQATLLSDELLRRLISVGQVDIVVGVPTLNHADTIAGTLDVVDQGLLRYFARARTVVIGADGGSTDQTLEIVADPSVAGAGTRIGGLRTRHRLAASYRGLPGRAGAIRLIFTAADLLQAQAVAMLDPDAPGLAPEWLGALLEPVTTRSLDVVAGVYARHPLEGLLVTQLIRPLMRAASGRQLEQPLLGAFGCSRRFAGACLAQDVWDRAPLREGIDLWLAGTALSADFHVGQALLGRLPAPAQRRPGPGLQDVFIPLVGALFTTLDQHAGTWLSEARSTPVPIISGAETPPMDVEAPPPVASGLGITFRQDVRDLRPVLEQILADDTVASLLAIADGGADVVRYDDELWVATVYDFAAAHHRGVIDRMHIVQALMPLYLGRVASFIGEHGQAPIADIQRHLERLAQAFERRRPYLIDRWHQTT